MALPYRVNVPQLAGECCGEYDWYLPTFAFDVIEHIKNKWPAFPYEFRHLADGSRNAKLVQTPYPFIMLLP